MNSLVKDIYSIRTRSLLLSWDERKLLAYFRKAFRILTLTQATIKSSSARTTLFHFLKLILISLMFFNQKTITFIAKQLISFIAYFSLHQKQYKEFFVWQLANHFSFHLRFIISVKYLVFSYLLHCIRIQNTYTRIIEKLYHFILIVIISKVFIIIIIS